MQTLFSNLGIALLDFVQISASFLQFFAALMLFSTVIIRVILARRNDDVSNHLNA